MSRVPPPPQPPYPPPPYGQPPFGGQPPYGQPPGGFPPPGGGYAMPPQKSTSGAAIASLILGILGCVPFITGLFAVILGIVGIKKTSDPRYSGRGLAIGGLVLGLLSLVLWGIFGGGLYAAYVYGKPAREVSNQFARDLSVGNIQAAQAKCTSTITRDDLEAASGKVKAWGVLQDTTLIAVMDNSAGTDAVEAAGSATFPNAGAVPYFLHLVKQGGELKIDGFALQHGSETVTAGTTPKSQSNSRVTVTTRPRR